MNFVGCKTKNFFFAFVVDFFQIFGSNDFEFLGNFAGFFVYNIFGGLNQNFSRFKVNYVFSQSFSDKSTFQSEFFCNFVTTDGGKIIAFGIEEKRIQKLQ